MAKVVKKTAANRAAQKEDRARATFLQLMQLGRLRLEKCELKEAQVAYGLALEQATKLGDLRAETEALAGLLRLAGETLEEGAITRYDRELDDRVARHPRQISPMVWYCKGVVARAKLNPRLAQGYFHRYLRLVRENPKTVTMGVGEPIELAEARGWVALASCLQQRGRTKRAEFLAHTILAYYQKAEFKGQLKGIDGLLYLLLGSLAERRRQLETATKWFQKAHAVFLAEHNWYYHLYVLYGYARIHRLNQNYSQAYWYLDLVEKAASGVEFGILRREVAIERSKLQQDAIDLLIDSRQGLIKTRESGQISLRKQYVLLHILEALFHAHKRAGDDMERGLSKAEIIESVWKENYRPEAHDNKLYYNINRLRKLIEPDLKKPQYLLNWKEGYRLAPGLRIQFVGTNALVRLEEGNTTS